MVPKMLPQNIFAEISSYLPGVEGDITRKQAGNIAINQKQRKNGKTYKNGALHSFDDEPSEILENGTMRWHKNGKLHRDDDKPAVVANGIMKWFKNGRLHREGDNPAYVNNILRMEQYWKNGQPHRDGDRPAVIRRPGTEHHYGIQEWWKNGKRHRNGDRAAFMNGTGYKEYWKNGLLHREGDRPAIRDGTIAKWYKNGVLHRDGGLPAIHRVKKNDYNEWWTNGQFIRRVGRVPYADSPESYQRHERFTSAREYRLREIER
jgi:antitoxin component YwqK of YwqJK toxin-antitoxin module